jgi:hypothetical protein
VALILTIAPTRKRAVLLPHRNGVFYIQKNAPGKGRLEFVVLVNISAYHSGTDIQPTGINFTKARVIHFGNLNFAAAYKFQTRSSALRI